jgi:ATP-dependent Lhr-like helicase
MDGRERLIHPELVSWARENSWERFSELQLSAFEEICTGDRDLILAGATARGKTEAAFLPLLTIAARRKAGVSALCISPRKALINDQHRRLEVLASRIGVRIYKWHGDASKSQKEELIKRQLGIVLMTPESFEGRLLLQPALVKQLFGQLDAILIDELHDFLGGVRGHQLACQLARLDQISDRPTRRIGLSATLGDFKYACEWLAPTRASKVLIIKEADVTQPFLYRIRGYEDAPRNDVPVGPSRLRPKRRAALGKIADALLVAHRRGAYLIFAKSKRDVESLCSLLKEGAQSFDLGNRFRVHHGNVGKGMRERLEQELREGAQLSLVTTTTLELGIDIGTVDGIDQIGAPTSLTSFRQRIGRSGRRDDPAMVTVHVTEQQLESSVSLLDRLRLDTVRAVAAINLLQKRFVEPPVVDGTMLTAVFQQTLSFISERGGATLMELQRLIRSVTPFQRLSEASYKQLYLSPEGKYFLAQKGEKLLESDEFYACFQTGAVWDVWSARERIGSISLANPVAIGNLLCLAGRSWRISAIQDSRNRIDVEPGPGGRIPYFDPGDGENIHEVLAKEMRKVLEQHDEPERGCDKEASRFLEEGRMAYSRACLGENALVDDGGVCHILTWMGSQFNALLAVLLRKKGFTCGANEISVTVPAATVDEIRQAITTDNASIDELAGFVEALLYGKFDKWIPEQVLRQDWADRYRYLEQPLTDFCTSLLERDTIPCDSKAGITYLKND